MLKTGSILKVQRKTPLKLVIIVLTLQIRKLKLLSPRGGQGEESAVKIPPKLPDGDPRCASPHPPPQQPPLDLLGREKSSPDEEHWRFL